MIPCVISLLSGSTLSLNLSVAWLLQALQVVNKETREHNLFAQKCVGCLLFFDSSHTYGWNEFKKAEGRGQIAREGKEGTQNIWQKSTEEANLDFSLSFLSMEELPW